MFPHTIQNRVPAPSSIKELSCTVVLEQGDACPTSTMVCTIFMRFTLDRSVFGR